MKIRLFVPRCAVLTVIHYLLFVASASAQLTEKEFKKGRELFHTVNTYNYSVMANQFLTNDSKRYRGIQQGIVVYESKLIKTGRKDYQGNEILQVHLYQDNKLKGKIVPDFEECALYGQLFYTDKSYKNEDDTMLYHSLVSLLPDTKQMFTGVAGGSTIDRQLVMASNTPTPKAFNSAKEWKHAEYQCTMASGIKGYDEFNKEQEKRLINDHKTMWEAVWTKSEKIIENAKGKTYDDLMKSNKPVSESYLVYLDKLKDWHQYVFKVVYKTDAKGMVNEIVFQFPFKDGKYYDKEQFYAKAVKEQNGMFRIKNSNKDLPLEDGGYIVPFEGALYLGSFQDNAFFARQAIVNDLFDHPMARNILDHGKLYSEYERVDIEREYKKWVELKAFLQQYEYKKDLLKAQTLFGQYLGVIKMK